MNTRPVDVSVVVPLYNEAGSVDELVRRVAAVLEETGRGWELVAVDDGSDDGTDDILRRLAAGTSRLRAFGLPRRRGQTAALRAGLARARGDVVVTLDGDLQNAPEDIPRLLDALAAGADVVAGWRRRRRDPWLTRRLPSALANAWIRRFTGIPIHDHGCALKAFRRELVDNVHLYGDHHRLITGVCAMHGARVREIEVSHGPRQRGRSKYGAGRTLRVLADVFSLHLLLRHRRRPSAWFFRLAAPFAAGAAAAALAAAWSARTGPFDPSMVWLGAAFILGAGATTLAAAGLFAELLLRLEPLHLQARGAPLSGGEAGS